MKHYKRMTWIDRLEIERLYNQGATYRAIADKIGKTPAAVYYEIKRGLYDHLDGSTWTTVKKYSAQIADDDARYQSTSRCGVIKLGHNHEFANHVSQRIINGESPDSIVGNLRNLNQWTVSTSTLYRYIDAGYIPNVTNDNLHDKPRRRRKYAPVRQAKANRGVSIEHRPKVVLDRSTFGHWEMDCVIGKSKGQNESLLVLTERMTRYELIFKLSAKTSINVNRIIESSLSSYPKGMFKSITVDNGSEFSLAHQLPVPVFYCHAFASCERGSNENCNRLIRRFFPKGQSMANRNQADADSAANAINNLYRKILNYHTAKELFDIEIAKLKFLENC